jgi:hypothetical protein
MRNLNRNYNPYFITGFCDAESCFHFDIKKDPRYKSGWSVVPKFYISLHKRDMELLKSIQNELGGIDSVSIRDKNAVQFQLWSNNDILKIIPFLKKYPIHGIKAQDFEDFCKLAELVKTGKHLTLEGLNEILNIKNSMNKGRKTDIIKDIEEIKITKSDITILLFLIIPLLINSLPTFLIIFVLILLVLKLSLPRLSENLKSKIFI